MDQNDSRFNVIEVTGKGHPKRGMAFIVPVRRPGSKNPLHNAKFRLCNSTHEFASGFVAGMMLERERLGLF